MLLLFPSLNLFRILLCHNPTSFFGGRGVIDFPFSLLCLPILSLLSLLLFFLPPVLSSSFLPPTLHFLSLLLQFIPLCGLLSPSPLFCIPLIWILLASSCFRLYFFRELKTSHCLDAEFWDVIGEVVKGKSETSMSFKASNGHSGSISAP